ncbi:VOC family protein [Conexibacter woesei]|uniref:VOC family protein n=1 Tax=Conexibacter woesei TaxID=191495 RepID=UPI00047C335C|nr:VOC family protein [Conexibacter woesei]
MGIQRMDHAGLTVTDMDAAVAFFTALGMENAGGTSVAGEDVDRIVGLDGVRSDVVMLQTPDGHNRIELSSFSAPPAEPGPGRALINVVGLRHVCFQVDDMDATIAIAREHGAELVREVVTWGSAFKLCYLWGPEGIIVELAEKL